MLPDFFADATRLSWSAFGSTSPNPPVGAVIEDASGNVVGRGATEPAGGRHAEIVALAEAGERARGGRAIVTLEPCNHIGRTGPCSEALITAGIARVDYLFADPFEPASGGADALRAAGIEVHGPYLPHPDQLDSWAPVQAVEAWLRGVKNKRPYVILKMAATLDGRVAAADRTSQWITGDAARQHAHTRRAQVDAIVVGTGTVLSDDPKLTARNATGDTLPPASQPLRVVVGETPIPETATLWTQPGETVVMPTRDVREVLRHLHDREVVTVLVEGGPTLAAAFLDAGMVDEINFYGAPALLGAGLNAVHGQGMGLGGTIAEIQRFTPREVHRLGNDIGWILTAKPSHTT
ncbi:bifunctional diaminohydroxyphosphoribosylaminopyrimidine deaminase/5-amino-6-(5-phosphoribosylamino)uracil reductase RibD [Corynebacterium auriscanis]|uniref:bifunctional diaminohydroxyphosphoribosylaminopyrimidine deaminase/5-amino-6-(5-phosphoribosylamino)uracil reductase RibD n=1 Tax=Corynebacterium auriscanis TaxID=99807 RepID=UPI003CF8BD65